MSHIAFPLDDASLRHMVDAVCRGSRHSKRRSNLEHLIVARGELTLAELQLYRRWFASGRAQRLLSERDHEMLQSWLTAVVKRAVMPTAKADDLHGRVTPMRPLRC